MFASLRFLLPVDLYRHHHVNLETILRAGDLYSLYTRIASNMYIKNTIVRDEKGNWTPSIQNSTQP